jgi:hypothetical protein
VNLPITLAGAATLVTTAVSIAVAAYQYRLKAQAEHRLADSALAENEVKLSTLFADLLRTANGYGEFVVSEAAITGLFEHGQITPDILSRTGTLRNIVRDECVFWPTQPWASQVSALASIVELGSRHDFLQRPAVNGLAWIHTDPYLCAPDADAATTRYRTEVGQALERLRSIVPATSVAVPSDRLDAPA